MKASVPNRTDSLCQSTRVAFHDAELNYFDPRLYIATHKTKSFLGDQLRVDRRTEHLDEWFKLSRAEQRLAKLSEPEREAIKKLKMDKIIKDGPPYKMPRNEGKRMGIQE